MKQVKIILSTILIITTIFKINAQGGSPGNTSFPLGFLGFNGIGPNIPLDIRNDFNNHIALKTAGAGLERMGINHRGPGLVLPGYAPFSMINPYPGNRLTRIGISIDGNSSRSAGFVILRDA